VNFECCRISNDVCIMYIGGSSDIFYYEIVLLVFI